MIRQNLSAAILVSLLCCHTVFAADYHIGPGQPLSRIADAASHGERSEGW